MRAAAVAGGRAFHLLHPRPPCRPPPPHHSPPTSRPSPTPHPRVASTTVASPEFGLSHWPLQPPVTWLARRVFDEMPTTGLGRFWYSHPPVPVAPLTTVACRCAAHKLFDEIGTNANPNPRTSVSAAAAVATPWLLPRSSSRLVASTARRRYSRPTTPARAISCPSAAHAPTAEAVASCCSSDMASTVTNFSKADGIMVVAAPCESPPHLSSVSCYGTVFLDVKKSLFGLVERITGLRESVAKKRTEVEWIRGSRNCAP